MDESFSFIHNQQFSPTKESFGRQSKAAYPYDSRSILNRIIARTCIINGRSDKIVPIRICEDLACGIGHTERNLFDGDHFIGWTSPEKVFPIADKFSKIRLKTGNKA